MCSSWSKGTEKQYRPAWQKWCSWCSKEQIDPLQATPAQVANFLSVEFGANKSYSTLNLYRSAISSTLHLIEENKIGEHPTVSRCMKGVMISGSTRKDMCTARGLEAIDGLKLLAFTSYLFYPFASTLNNEIMTWCQK